MAKRIRNKTGIKRPKVDPVVREQQILELRSQGLTQQAIAKQLKCSNSDVNRIVKQHNLPLLKPGKKPKANVPLMLELKSQGVSYRKIAQTVGMHKSSVARYLTPPKQPKATLEYAPSIQSCETQN